MLLSLNMYIVDINLIFTADYLYYRRVKVQLENFKYESQRMEQMKLEELDRERIEREWEEQRILEEIR